MVRKQSNRNAARKPVVGKRANKKKTTKKEITLLGGLIRGLGGLGGGAIGSMAGNTALGSTLGTAAGAQLSKWLGTGDYAVTKNSLMLKGSDSIPVMHNSGQSIIVRHREYVGDVYSSTGAPSLFGVHATYPLNPGLPGSFPWLSTVAQNFVEYSWRGVVYQYIPTSGMSVASTNTGLGSVMMATNYRSTAPAYTNKQTMLNEFFASDARPSEPFLHPIECDPKENPYNVQYIRTGPVPTGEDQKTYDLGVTTIASQGCPAATINLGELWVSYEVELRKPKALGTYQFDALTYKEARTSVTSDTANFGATAGTISPTDETRVTVGAETITVDKSFVGRFVLIVAWDMSEITGLAKPVYTITGGVQVGSDIGQVGTTITANEGHAVSFGIFESLDSTAPMVITCTNNVFAGTCATVYIRIMQVNTMTI